MLRGERVDHLLDMVVDAAKIYPRIIGGNAEGAALAHSLGMRRRSDQRLGGNGAGAEGVAAEAGLLDQHHRSPIGPRDFSDRQATGSGPDDAEVGSKDIGQSRPLGAPGLGPRASLSPAWCPTIVGRIKPVWKSADFEG